MRPRYCTVKTILGRRQPGANEMNFVMASSPARYHCTTDASPYGHKPLYTCYMLLRKDVGRIYSLYPQLAPKNILKCSTTGAVHAKSLDEIINFF